MGAISREDELQYQAFKTYQNMVDKYPNREGRLENIAWRLYIRWLRRLWVVAPQG